MKTLNPLTRSRGSSTHQRQIPYISYRECGVGDACVANKVTVICAILFQSWLPRVPLESTGIFLLQAKHTESACLERKHINKVKWNTIIIIESPFVSPLRQICCQLLIFNGAEAHHVLFYLGRADVIGILKGFSPWMQHHYQTQTSKNMSFVGGDKIINISF